MTFIFGGLRKSEAEKTYRMIMDLMRKKGANTSYQGRTLLMYAIYIGAKDLVKQLIGCGAKINARDDTGWTALMYAAYHGNIEIAEILINKGADVNATDNSGKTALDYAHWGIQEQMISFLVEHGAVGEREVDSHSYNNSSTSSNSDIKKG